MLNSQDQGKKVSEIYRDVGISEPTFYNWKGSSQMPTSSFSKLSGILKKKLAQHLSTDKNNKLMVKCVFFRKLAL
jgi:hypothetical protein